MRWPRIGAGSRPPWRRFNTARPRGPSTEPNHPATARRWRRGTSARRLLLGLGELTRLGGVLGLSRRSRAPRGRDPALQGADRSMAGSASGAKAERLRRGDRLPRRVLGSERARGQARRYLWKLHTGDPMARGCAEGRPVRSPPSLELRSGSRGRGGSRLRRRKGARATER